MARKEYPPMAKRHFEFIASILNDTKPLDTASDYEHRQWRLTVTAFSTMLGRTNDLFKRDTFKRACGLED